MRKIFDNLAVAIFLLTVMFTALAQGTVEAWSRAIFELLVVILALVWAGKIVVEKKLAIQLPDTALPLFSFFLLGVFQCLAFTGASGEIASLSRDVEATRNTVFLFLFLLGAFLIAANFFVEAGRLRLLANFLVIYGFALAMFALLQHFTWNGKFYWVRANTQSASPFGPFVNHNHYSGYMELLIPVAIALAMDKAAKSEARIFYGFAAFVMMVSAVAALSRGGFISLAATALFIGLCKLFAHSKARAYQDARAAWHGRQAKPGLRLLKTSALLAAVCAVALLGLMWIGPDRFLGRVTGGQLVSSNQGEESFFTSRGWIWRDTLLMIKAHPLLGVGLGAYETAYATYSVSDTVLLVGQAHNDYLQVLADAGVVGGALVIWFLVMMFKQILTGLQARESFKRALALGSGAGIFAILVHSFFDFNLQIPSSSLVFLTLLAMLGQTAKKTMTEGRALQTV
ncbi:MAG: O-antigen ligase family protein [Acidobacteriota bacterium]